MSLFNNVLRGVVASAVVASFGAAAFGAAFTAGDIAVVHVHDGTKLNSSPSQVYIDEYTTSGTLVQSIALPATATSSGNRACVESGSATSEGSLFLSLDERFLCVGGYNATAAHTGNSPADDPASTTNRVVGIIKSDGTVDTTTALNNVFNSNNFRAVVSDGTSFWLAGNSSGDKTSEGIQYVAAVGDTSGSAFTAGDASNTSPGNLYRVAFDGTSLYPEHRKLDSDYIVNGIAKISTGVTTPYTMAGTDWIINNQTSPHVLDNIADLRIANTGNSSHPKVIYVASDDTTTDGNAAGILKFVSDSSGNFSSTPSQVFTSSAFTHGFAGLTVHVDTGTHAATLYLTTSDGNNIVKFTDTDSSSSSSTGTFTLLASPGSKNDSYRGVDFVPTVSF